MKPWWDGILELLFPSDVRCSLCGNEEGMGEGYGICRSCYRKLPFRHGREERVGIPCFWPLSYEGEVRRMITGLKFENKRYFALPLARIMEEAWQETHEEIDVIVPIPLHREREKKRGFNQSILLGAKLGEGLHLPLWRDALLRIRNTRPQMELTREERQENLIGAFRLSADVAGKRILLVDDVLTTGASIREAAVQLQLGGAEVLALCCARAEEHLG